MMGLSPLVFFSADGDNDSGSVAGLLNECDERVDSYRSGLRLGLGWWHLEEVPCRSLSRVGCVPRRWPATQEQKLAHLLQIQVNQDSGFSAGHLWILPAGVAGPSFVSLFQQCMNKVGMELALAFLPTLHICSWAPTRLGGVVAPFIPSAAAWAGATSLLLSAL
jgi:hypothetical protein